jgi:hypothetical protein
MKILALGRLMNKDLKAQYELGHLKFGSVGVRCNLKGQVGSRVSCLRQSSWRNIQSNILLQPEDL